MAEVWHPAERWSEAERRVWQERRLREVAEAGVGCAAALRERLERSGLRPGVLSLEALAAVPILRKETLPAAQEQNPPFGGWLGVPAPSLSRLFRSPGPIYDPEGREDDYWSFAPALFAAGFRAGDVVLNTLSYHLTPAGLMFDGALRALGCPVVPAGPGNSDVQVRLLADLPVTGFVGTPSFLATVLDAAEAAGVAVRLRAAFVIAEMLAESLRERLERRFGLRISQGYGIADLGSIGYECPARTGLHLWHEVIVELLDPQSGAPAPPGAPGEVVVTPLNPTYPLLRLGTGDLSMFAEGPCPCGRTGPRLARILGRVGDAVKVRGMFVHPAEVGRLISRYPEVARWQVEVTRSGHADAMVVRAEVRPDATDIGSLRERLRQGVVEALRLRAEIEIVPEGSLPADAKPILDRRTWE